MKRIFTGGCVVLFFLSTCLLLASLWISYMFGSIGMNQIVANACQPLDGVATFLVVSGILFIGILGVFITGIVVWMVRYFCPRYNVFLYFGFSFLFLVFPCYKQGVLEYVRTKTTHSNIYEKKYVLPKIKASGRNLIFIVIESFEKSYRNTKAFEKDLSPLLTELEKQNISFSGFYQLPIIGWTLTSIGSSLCGVPVQWSGFMTDISMVRSFLPKLTCWPQLLEKQGYRNYLMKAASVQFSGTHLFAYNHGFKEVLGFKELQEKYGKTDNDPWGLNDHQIFHAARDKLTLISKGKTPFFFMVVQAGTHQPSGYVNKYCTRQYNNYKDAVLCTDQEVASFIDWVKQQPFYKNTTIVVAGDHLLPHSDIDANLEKVENREIYFTILNPGVKIKPVPHKFTNLDIAPTILDALGVDFSGVFGLGRSLFRMEKTLVEEFPDDLNFQLSCLSKVYEDFGPRLGKSFYENPSELPVIPLNRPIDVFLEINKSFAAFNIREIVLGEIWTEGSSGSIKIKVPQTAKLSGLSIDFDLLVPVFSETSSKILKVIVNNKLLASWLFTKDTKPLTRIFVSPELIPSTFILKIDLDVKGPKNKKGYQGFRFKNFTLRPA